MIKAAKQDENGMLQSAMVIWAYSAMIWHQRHAEVQTSQPEASQNVHKNLFAVPEVQSFRVLAMYV